MLDKNLKFKFKIVNKNHTLPHKLKKKRNQIEELRSKLPLSLKIKYIKGIKINSNEINMLTQFDKINTKKVLIKSKK